MRKKTLWLCMMLMMIATTGCKNNPVSEPLMTGAEQEVTSNVQPVGSYKKLYKRLNTITAKQKLEQLRNFGKYFTSEDKECSVECVEDSATMETESSSKADYGSTNVVTEGIDEGDIIKNDGEYLYLYEYEFDTDAKTQIRIIKVDDEEMETVSIIEPNDDTSIYGEESLFLKDFYLADDTLILFEDDHESIKISFYDISDRSNPKLAQTRTQEGLYVSSRMDNNYMYLVTEKVNDYQTNIAKEEYIPEVDDCLVSADCIYIPEIGETKNFVTCASFSLNDDYKVKDNVSVLTTGENFYMSESNMYLYGTGVEDNVTKTEVMRIAYENGELAMEAEGKVDGYISDSFAINEYNGYLRLVMMQNTYRNVDYVVLEDSVSEIETETQEENCLYVLDQELKVVGEIGDIAPGENIYSARFIGDIGYFVTFRQIDPLFSVDLSDPKNPKIIGELKIPGFSEYLHPYSEDLLLGIGVEVENNAQAGLKLSMFDISDPSDVKELDKTVLKQYDYSDCLYEYKALCISPKKNVFGFASEGYGGDTWYRDYNLYSYDKNKGFTRHKVVTCDLEKEYISDIRGTYVGDTFYTVVFGNKMIATDLNTMEELGIYEFGE